MFLKGLANPSALVSIPECATYITGTSTANLDPSVTSSAVPSTTPIQLDIINSTADKVTSPLLRPLSPLVWPVTRSDTLPTVLPCTPLSSTTSITPQCMIDIPTPESPAVPTPESPVVPTPESPVVPTPESPVVPTPESSVVPTPESELPVSPELPLQPLQTCSLSPAQADEVVATSATSNSHWSCQQSW